MSRSFSCLSPLHYHVSSESVSRETTDQHFRPSQSFAYWYYFFFFSRLDTKSLERASMDYEAPLMPCGCILPPTRSHILGPQGPDLEPRERARSCGVEVGSGPLLWARAPGGPQQRQLGEDGKTHGSSATRGAAGTGAAQESRIPSP